MAEKENNIFGKAKELRQQLLQEYSLGHEDKKYPLSVAYFWPTKYCPIGCEHCMFSSPKPRGIDREMILDKTAIDHFIQISHQAKLDALIVSGGGEPMLELPTVLKLIQEAHYNYFEIITGAHWVASEKLTRRTLNQLQQAITTRKQQGHDFSFSFRISIDSYHQKVVKLEWLKRLVGILRDDAVLKDEEKKYPDLKLFFRTLLIEDDIVEQFSELLGTHLGEMNNYVRELEFNDEKTKGINSLKVFYKDMRFVGHAKEADVTKLVQFDQYFDSYSDKNKDVRLGMTYLKQGSKGEALEGINVFVTYEGKMMPYGGVADVSSNIYFESYEEFIAKLFHDIISRTLLLKGLAHVERITEEIDPQLRDRIIKKNWIASVADESLDTAEKRLYVTLRLLQNEIASGDLRIENLPAYVVELVSREPIDLRQEYFEHINATPNIEHSYANENITIIQDTKIKTN